MTEVSAEYKSTGPTTPLGGKCFVSHKITFSPIQIYVIPKSKFDRE